MTAQILGKISDYPGRTYRRVARSVSGRLSKAHMEALAEKRPLMLNIETTTLCNARCTFCAYPKLERPKTIMTMALFEKLCAEFDAMGGGYLGFSPVMSDPLVDPLLFERIDHCARYKNITFHLFTNGIRLVKLSDEELKKLLSTMQIINISIGGLEREDYKTMFHVDKFDDVLEGLERLADLRRSSGSACKLSLHIRTNKKEAVLAHPTLKHLQELGYVCGDILDAFANWNGVVKREDIPEGANYVEADNSGKTKSCVFPMIYLAVLPDGKVSGCSCMDGPGSAVVGDLNDSSLSGIWNSERAKKFRFSFPRGEVPDLCKNCSYYTPADRIFKRKELRTYRYGENVWEKLQ